MSTAGPSDAPTLISRSSSSRISRTAACSSVSPGSTLPPGNSQPSSGPARYAASTSPSRTTATPTTICTTRLCQTDKAKLSAASGRMTRMPLQNRVLPTQEIVADPGRGLLMGNRGALHGPDRRLGTTRWRTNAWICCVLDWKGVRRDPMPPGRWTALFFFDEAVALAAGHRPCAYCRRRDFLLYARAWATGRGLDERPRAPAMDAQLHLERV